MAITNTGHNKQVQFLHDLLSHARVTVGGQVFDNVPFFEIKREGSDVVTVHVYLDDRYSGTVSRIQLIDKDGAVFDDQPESVSKPTINGLLAVFKYTLRRV
ncbi:hypothetical protein HWB91_gp06 [Bacillus phage vB_BboS-125]|uniref:Uncharacterized protein n=1 Tax=Bacillus phage vB_BboS-125 TaxID=2419618 RepID=A0A3G3BW92_9CAUD|nr:hypothetical protein HWB91_gp06 [Bacillus phage vB_BboS-125]AYP68376.1 hypothetical protein BboS125_00006 [Bacillus phage vB_BboS-125]